MKKINKLMVVLGLASALVGCGNPEMLSSSAIKWEPAASEYLNKHLAKPNGAKSEWKLEVKNDQGIQIVSVFIDGQKAAWTLCNPANGVKTHKPVCEAVMFSAVSAIHWNESDGYRVGTYGPRLHGEYGLGAEQGLDFVNDLRPIFKAKGVIF